jgi:hypothetical protein
MKTRSGTSQVLAEALRKGMELCSQSTKGIKCVWIFTYGSSVSIDGLVQFRATHRSHCVMQRGTR